MDCCFQTGKWHKPSAKLGLASLPKNQAVTRCYMNELGSCAGGISGEHLISEAVIEVLRGDGDFTISGLPWLQIGETKKIGPSSLTAKCLCEKHNSALTNLDSSAQLFFSALRECTEAVKAPEPFLLSGHDIERWLLKTMKAMAVSGNLASGRIKLPGIFERGVDIIQMLDDPQSWPNAAGMYFIMPSGSRINNSPRFRLQPWYGEAKSEIVGLWASCVGLEFVMMIAAPNISKSPGLKNWLYRPGEIDFTIGSSNRKIALSWEDDLRHDPISLKFEKFV